MLHGIPQHVAGVVLCDTIHYHGSSTLMQRPCKGDSVRGVGDRSEVAACVTPKLLPPRGLNVASKKEPTFSSQIAFQIFSQTSCALAFKYLNVFMSCRDFGRWLQNDSILDFRSSPKSCSTSRVAASLPLWCVSWWVAGLCFWSAAPRGCSRC